MRQATVVEGGATLVNADGWPIASNRPDPKAVALAALEHDNAALRAEVARRQSGIVEAGIEPMGLQEVDEHQCAFNGLRAMDDNGRAHSPFLKGVLSLR